MRRRLAIAAVVLLPALAACDGKAKPQRQPVRNLATIGFVDAPADQATVGPSFTVAGWAIDESAVDRVRVYLDDDLVVDVPLTVMRPDVEQAYRLTFGLGTPHGFTAAVDAGSRKGYCTIRFEALDGRGALTQFSTRTVRIEP